MRFNRLQLGGLEIRNPHRFAQLRPSQLQVSLGRNQLLFAGGPIHQGRHSVRLHRKTSLDMLLNRVQQGLCCFLLMLSDIDLALRIENRLIGSDNAEDDLLVHGSGG